MDLIGDPSQRDPVSSCRLPEKTPIVNLSAFKGDEKELRTLAAIRDGAKLNYSGRLSAGDLQGNPDLPRREGERYVAVDIKSGQGEEGGDDDADGKPKRHYAAQLTLYTDILERLGLSAGHRGIILDIHQDEVPYDLTQPRRPRYPDVCPPEEIEEIFDPARSVDLYTDVVQRATEWPTNDHSIKTLAKYFGFIWRDQNPSGAASIEWFGRWTETRDISLKQRILDYNEDDCRAASVPLDGIRGLARPLQLEGSLPPPPVQQGALEIPKWVIGRKACQ
jgi:predicted RecB family nuclease